jgi:hypothetical protein
MIRKAFVFTALLLIPAIASADTGNIARDAGPFEFTLGGSGSNSKDFDNGGGSIAGSFGWWATPNIELSVRDNASYNDSGNGSSWGNQVRVAIDLAANLDRFQPFIGANIGYISGTNVHDTAEGAPEAGLKFFLNNSTFIYGMVEYNFFFNSSGNTTFDKGQFLYGVGLGMRF